MKILFAALALVAAAVVACNTCTPGPRDEPAHCTPLPDAGAPECQGAQTCTGIIGPADAGVDNRCLDACQSGGCAKAGFVCQPAAIGNCGAQFGGDGGACETRFLCMPNYCGG